MHQSCFIIFNLFLIYVWIPAQGSTWLSASWTASVLLAAGAWTSAVCWWHARLAGARGSQGHGPGLGEAAFCASTHHKRWPQAALAGPPLSMLFWAGRRQARCSGSWTGTNSLDPTRISKPIHLQDASTALPVAVFYISPRPPGPFRVFLSFLLQAASSFLVAGHFLSFKHFRYIAFFFFYILCIIHSFITNDIRHSFVVHI